MDYEEWKDRLDAEVGQFSTLSAESLADYIYERIKPKEEFMDAKSEAIHLTNKVNALNLPYKKLLEPEFSEFFIAQDDISAKKLMLKYQLLKKARIVRIMGRASDFPEGETFYSLEWKDLAQQASARIAYLEEHVISEHTIYAPIYFVPFGVGWTVAENMKKVLEEK